MRGVRGASKVKRFGIRIAVEINFVRASLASTSKILSLAAWVVVPSAP